VITGSTVGIGKSIAKTFSKHGGRIVVNSRASVDAGRELADSLPDASYVPGDVSREDGAKQVVEAGETSPHEDLAALDDSTWQGIILNVNLLVPWYVTRAAVPALRTSGDGVVINIRSLSAVRSMSWGGNTIACVGSRVDG
jgi:ketoreductase RED2